MIKYNVYEDGDVSITQILKLLLSNYKFIILVTSLLTMVTIGVSSYQPKTYLSKITITYNQPDGMQQTSSSSSLGGLSALAPLNIDFGMGNSKEEEYYAILLSRKNLSSFLSSNSEIRNYFKRLFPTVDESTENTIFLESAINTIENSTTVSRSKVTGITDIYFVGTEKNITAIFLNDLIRFTNQAIGDIARVDASQKIEYLNEESKKTSLRNLQNIFDRLIEAQIKNQMLSNTVKEYAFKIIDPAIEPNNNSGPRTFRNALISFIVGLFLSFFIVILRNESKL